MYDVKNTLLITDMDGTLLPASKQIMQIDYDAIVRFRQAGGKFTIATGRTIQATQRYIDRLEIDVPMIAFNGAAIYNPVKREYLYQEYLPEDVLRIAQQVRDLFPEISIEILRPFETSVAHMTPWEELHLQICAVEGVLCDLDTMPHDDWIKVLFAMDPNRMEGFTAYVREQQLHSDDSIWNAVDFVQSDPKFFEILPKNATKGTALEKYKSICRMENVTTVAAGDFDNDLDMLRVADIGACPSNAQPCVKEITKIHLARSCEEGAIAELIDMIMNNQEVGKA